MTVSFVLTDWDDYDLQKQLCHSDALLFDHTAAWELTYLKEKIRHIYPFIPDATITKTIRQYCAELNRRCEREEFVSCVLERLGIPL